MAGKEEQKEATESNEDRLLSALDRLSLEGRVRAVGNLAETQEITEKYFAEARDYYLEHSYDYGTASIAGLAKRTNRLEETIKRYEESGKTLTAAGIAKCGGEHEKAVELFEKLKYYQTAAEIAEGEGWIDKAIELYQKESGGWKRESREKAIKLAEKHGRKEKAIDLHEFYGDWDKAIKAAEELGMKKRVRSIKEKAMQYYEENNRLLEAAKIAEELGMAEKARSFLTEILSNNYKGWYEGSASEVALRLGDKKMALNIKIKENRCHIMDLARFAEEQELYEEAIDLWLRENKRCAARVMQKAGMLERALEIYEKEAHFSEDLINAARIAKQLGQSEKSKEFYNKAIAKEEKETEEHYYSRNKFKKDEKLAEAAEIAKEAGDIEKAISLYRKTRYHYEKAFELAKEHGKVETAIEIYSGNNPDWLEKAARLAEENNQLTRAMNLYAKSFEIRESKKEFLHAARIAKKIGLEKKAAENYISARGEAEKKGNWKACLEIAKETDDGERIETYQDIIKALEKG